MFGEGGYLQSPLGNRKTPRFMVREKIFIPPPPLHSNMDALLGVNMLQPDCAGKMVLALARADFPVLLLFVFLWSLCAAFLLL